MAMTYPPCTCVGVCEVCEIVRESIHMHGQLSINNSALSLNP